MLDISVVKEMTGYLVVQLNTRGNPSVSFVFPTHEEAVKAAKEKAAENYNLPVVVMPVAQVFAAPDPETGKVMWSNRDYQ